MTLDRKIRVLVVDDSAVVRKLASEALNSDPEVEVVGTAADPYAARDLVRELNPDVLTLDLEMPKMDGLTFLRLLMQHKPLPVVVMSSLSQNGSDYAYEALRLGAVEVIGKPGGSYSFGDLGPQLIAKVKAASIARVRPGRTADSTSPVVPRSDRPGSRRTWHPRALILLGASTGGTEALRDILKHLPGDLPPIAIAQHIPAGFSSTFARRLDSQCTFSVREAADDHVLEPGTAIVAPGNFHLLLNWDGMHYRTRVTGGPPVWHQRPAIDLLFKSAADCGAAPHAICGILTGMGKDGAEGLLRLHEKGATTFAQDEATSVVYGMPRVAWEIGAADFQIPLERIANFLATRSTLLAARVPTPHPAATQTR